MLAYSLDQKFFGFVFVSILVIYLGLELYSTAKLFRNFLGSNFWHFVLTEFLFCPIFLFHFFHIVLKNRQVHNSSVFQENVFAKPIFKSPFQTDATDG